MKLSEKVAVLKEAKIGKHLFANICNFMADEARRPLYKELGLEMRPSIWVYPAKKKKEPYIPERDTEEREEHES